MRAEIVPVGMAVVYVDEADEISVEVMVVFVSGAVGGRWMEKVWSSWHRTQNTRSLVLGNLS
jgi:hypothetical protein